jgi:hypothetical protein
MPVTRHRPFFERCARQGRRSRHGGSAVWGARAALASGLAFAASELACNAVLDIERADLACPPAGCDATTELTPASSDALGGETAASAPGQGEGADVSGSPIATAPGAASLASPGEVAPGNAPSAPPIGAGAVRDAGTALDASSGPDTPPPEERAPAGPPLDDRGFAVPLPNDLIGAPVSGEIIFSEEAQWEVDGAFRPTFEVHTPTGSYWIVKSLGTMVSMQDAYAGRSQWIDFSSGFRPLRNIPAFGAPPAVVSTVLDRDSQTPTHLRLISDSTDGAWHWVWDFYITHVTFTLDRAPVPIGFAYRGVPAGELGPEDQLIQSDGRTQGARNSFNGDASGPVEWVYLADTAARRSLFLMQHTDDAAVETYQVRDNDSAHWVFGGGQIATLPIRFSLGLIDSVDHALVGQRAAFVAGAIR